jgi:hypothetical protein
VALGAYRQRQYTIACDSIQNWNYLKIRLKGTLPLSGFFIGHPNIGASEEKPMTAMNTKKMACGATRKNLLRQRKKTNCVSFESCRYPKK